MTAGNAGPSTRADGQVTRLGVFGGSFDPVHAGHLHAARAARDERGLERVLFVPAARPPHKPGRALAPAEHRLAMLALALEAEPAFALDRRELERAGPSYTIDTVRSLAAPGLAIHLILGSDNLPGLPDWRDVHELLERVEPVVVYRAGDARELPPAVIAALSPSAVARLERGFLRLPPLDCSATDLRELLARGGDPGPLLPPGVLAYVREHGLYRA